MSTTSIVTTKVTASLISKITPKFGNWFFKKLTPFEMEHFIIQFEFIPYIIVNNETINNELRMCFNLQNFTIYEAEIYGYECTIQAASQPFMSLKSSEHFILKPNQKHKCGIEFPLGSGDLRRATVLKEKQEIHPANYSFSFQAKTRFGQQQINIPRLPNGIIID